MMLSDLKEFERWFHERIGVTYAEAEQSLRHMDLRTIKAAYAAGMTRGTQETMKVMARPLTVELPAPLKQVGWRWRYANGDTSKVFRGDGPTSHALASANYLKTFAPVSWEPVYALAVPQ